MAQPKFGILDQHSDSVLEEDKHIGYFRLGAEVGLGVVFGVLGVTEGAKEALVGSAIKLDLLLLVLETFILHLEHIDNKLLPQSFSLQIDDLVLLTGRALDLIIISTLGCCTVETHQMVTPKDHREVLLCLHHLTTARALVFLHSIGSLK